MTVDKPNPSNLDSVNDIEVKIKNKLNEINEELKELNDLREDYKNKSEWHRFMHNLEIKKYLIEEILGIE